MVEIITFIVGWVVPIIAGGAGLAIAAKLIWGSEKSTKEAKETLGRWLGGMVAIVTGIPVASNFFSPLTDGIKKILSTFLPGVPNLDLISKTVGQLICIALLVSVSLAALMLLWGTETSVMNSKKRATSLLIGVLGLFLLFAFGDKLVGMLKNPIPDAAKKLGL